MFLLKQNTRASAGVENVEAATVSVTAAVARRSFFILALGRLMLVTGLPSFTGMTNFTAAVTRVIANNRLAQPPNEVCASSANPQFFGQTKSLSRFDPVRGFVRSCQRFVRLGQASGGLHQWGAPRQPGKTVRMATTSSVCRQVPVFRKMFFREVRAVS